MTPDELIAHARDDIPTLLAEVRRLRGWLDWFADFKDGPTSGAAFDALNGDPVPPEE